MALVSVSLIVGCSSSAGVEDAPSVSVVELAGLIESVAPGCAAAIEAGESDFTDYPAGRLDEADAMEALAIVEAGSCSGSFPSIYLMSYASPGARLWGTVESARRTCDLGTETIRYVHGADWMIDAPRWQGFPGEEIARLATGTFVSRDCGPFTVAYVEELGEGRGMVPFDTNVSEAVLRTLLGE